MENIITKDFNWWRRERETSRESSKVEFLAKVWMK
ncbi:hypothetical protein E2C01_062194 [Portunus trituberculatus]|uniref:Uncharacterized protein n=1 Tax=Portunus trituberculatus TaxID=210409 RepID=A0A5B7HEG5_PORTR|nr:hypothetical protein [Portunus trituberculatus]